MKCKAKKEVSRKIKWPYWLLLMASAAFISPACVWGQAAEVKVFAAASLADSLKEIATAYKQKSGDRIVFNLGASYKVSKNVTLNARINNLFDRDFTSYTSEFRDLNGNGVYQAGTNEVLHYDDYNNKEKARSFWVSMNVRF